ncbi:MAG: hypothetical protein KAT37_00545 [Candidatus Aenigmarchaeota archaeon]|nr:hypothetical protein [Candidatus Aenigmarchaeota archaeon]
MEYSEVSYFREVLDEINNWELWKLKGARDSLNQTFKEAWNYVLWKHYRLEVVEDKLSEDEDRYYFESKIHPNICFKFSEGKLFGKYDCLGAYEKTREGIKPIMKSDGSIVSMDKGSILNSIYDKIKEKKPKKSFNWSG